MILQGRWQEDCIRALRERERENNDIESRTEEGEGGIEIERIKRLRE